MPAIQPARLKVQSARLAITYTQPGEFVRGLHGLLDSYADHTHRSGQSGTPPPLLSSYNPPIPVLRQIWQDLRPLVITDPQAGLVLCDALWAEPYLEHRLLAAQVLGQIPIELAEPVTERLRAWANSNLEEHLVQALSDQGMACLRHHAKEQIFNLVQEWLDAPNISTRQLGLQTLIPLVEDASFENLPGIFRLLAPYLRIAPSKLRPDLLAVLAILAHRSPQETAFTLRLALTQLENPDTPWLIRHLLTEFPLELQKSLRAALKAAE
jgi:hypothetical protein